MASRRGTRVRTGDIQVEGLRELNRALRDMGGKPLQQELKAVGNDAAEIVANRAKGIAESLGGVAKKTAPSIRAAATGGNAGVKFGGARYPFAAGAEFGAVRFRQFKPWRGNGPDAGYFVYEGVRQEIDEVFEQYERGVMDLARRYGLVE